MVNIINLKKNVNIPSYYKVRREEEKGTLSLFMLWSKLISRSVGVLFMK